MFELNSFFAGLGVLVAVGLLSWLVSIPKRDVSIVDSLWSVMFMLVALTYFVTLEQTGPRASLVLALVAIWGLRLSLYITWRNWGEPEDRRYQAM